jgi:hypothetical protein
MLVDCYLQLFKENISACFICAISQKFVLRLYNTQFDAKGHIYTEISYKDSS